MENIENTPKKKKGGAMPGAGRPKSENPRQQHQVRATAEEWEIIKKFIFILKSNPEKAIGMMNNV